MLVSGLAALIALSRAGTTIFWRTQGTVLTEARERISPLHLLSAGLLTAMTVVLVVAAGPLTEWSMQAASELRAGLTVQQINDQIPGGVR